MKVQSLAIIFIIIILPISLVLATYTQTRVETLSLQTQYDSKLKDATYDAIKAYQLNSYNSETSNYTNSKLRDIKASVNTFFNSLSTNFSSIGYTKTTIQNYVPALVYTMYDGYYIYSNFTNTWDNDTIGYLGDAEELTDKTPGSERTYSYQNGETLYSLKPYIYYSCRYKKNNTDIVITYSLDNYIQIQGLVGVNSVNISGYLLNNVEDKGDHVQYNYTNDERIEIYKENEIVKERVYFDGNIQGPYPCIKVNDTKYYYDDSSGEVFSVLNEKKMTNQTVVTVDDFNNNSSSIKYYKESLTLKKYIEDHDDLKNLTAADAVDTDGKNFSEGNNPFLQVGNQNIFDFNNIEAKDSNFNTHRIDVIKYSIEKNLSVAISNFNKNSGLEFRMPKLKDTDWDKITDNISMITFLQGMNIGGKVYNGYSVITNTKNRDVVMEDSIYMQTSDNVLHAVTEEGLSSDVKGVFNINAERRQGTNDSGNVVYYYPVEGTLSYYSLITQTKIAPEVLNGSKTIREYLVTQDKTLVRAYYTALGRERYSIDRKKLEWGY